jgi:hypothetical protein
LVPFLLSSLLSFLRKISTCILYQPNQLRSKRDTHYSDFITLAYLSEQSNQPRSTFTMVRYRRRRSFHIEINAMDSIRGDDGDAGSLSGVDIVGIGVI